MRKTTTTNQKKSCDIRKRKVAIFREVMNDSDACLELTERTKTRLKKSATSKKQGRVTSLDVILRKYR